MSLILSGTVNFFSIPVTWATQAVDSYDDKGNLVEGANTTDTIMATIVPVTGDFLKDMPEGVRSEAKHEFYTTSTVKIDDVITYEGFDRRVCFVAPWTIGGFTHGALGKKV